MITQRHGRKLASQLGEVLFLCQFYDLQIETKVSLSLRNFVVALSVCVCVFFPPHRSYIMLIKKSKIKLFAIALMDICVYVKVSLLWVMKGSYFGFGSLQQQVTCIQAQKHFHILIICIYFYLICSTTPK